jgi:hypothetical protein
MNGKSKMNEKGSSLKGLRSKRTKIEKDQDWKGPSLKRTKLKRTKLKRTKFEKDQVWKGPSWKEARWTGYSCNGFSYIGQINIKTWKIIEIILKEWKLE